MLIRRTSRNIQQHARFLLLLFTLTSRSLLMVALHRIIHYHELAFNTLKPRHFAAEAHLLFSLDKPPSILRRLFPACHVNTTEHSDATS